jgi:FtsP/CotA-like multicopper oxidase with cupredoxin domain
MIVIQGVLDRTGVILSPDGVFSTTRSPAEIVMDVPGHDISDAFILEQSAVARRKRAAGDVLDFRKRLVHAFLTCDPVANLRYGTARCFRARLASLLRRRLLSRVRVNGSLHMRSTLMKSHVRYHTTILLSSWIYLVCSSLALAEKFSTGGDFDKSPDAEAFKLELPRIPEKTPLSSVDDLLLPKNGGVAPNGTVYPQIKGKDALTVYPYSLDRIVAPHQRNSDNNRQFPPQKYYVLDIRQARHTFHTDPPYDDGSIIWGYDSIYPGPTFKSHYGRPLLVRIINNVYDDKAAYPSQPGKSIPGGFGEPRFTTHLHNGHTAFESDGNPADFYPPVDSPPWPPLPPSIKAIRFRDHHYAMFRAGLDPTQTDTRRRPNINDGDMAETVSTLWYHDHTRDRTAENTYKGLVGFHLFFDECDTGNELDPAPALKLPSGTFDVPLLIQDKRFDKNGELLMTPVTQQPTGFLGDKFVVNGIIQPHLNVKQRRYRFRLLNAGPSRFYQLFITKSDVDQPFKHIGNDESLFEKPIIDAKSVLIAVAERADIVVDFEPFAKGDTLYLENRLKMREDGQGPETDDQGNFIVVPPGTGDKILQFVVGDEVTDPSNVPAKLRDKPKLPDVPSLGKNLIDLTPQQLKDLKDSKKFEFNLDGGQWLINGEPFEDVRPYRYVVHQGPPQDGEIDGEVWTIKNETASNWSHPIHIHLEEFQILYRDGSPPKAYEKTKKDVLLIKPNEEVQIFLRFRDFLGKYPIHCHNVVHEDHFMMLRYDVVW